MTAPKTPATPITLVKLGADALRFLRTLDMLDKPQEVLSALGKAIKYVPGLHVLGAVLLPLKWGDWEAIEKDKTLFMHRSVPAGWWEEHYEMTKKSPGPSLMVAQMSLAPFTHTEITRLLEPIGIDRWATELGLKYGIRDLLTCPVGGRWIVVYWSPKVIVLPPEARAILFMAANFTAIRLQRLIEPQAKRIGRGTALTPRELAVLRIISVGKPMREVAKMLMLGGETIRSHLKKAESKLGVHDRTHAVAQAIRQHLIP